MNHLASRKFLVTVLGMGCLTALQALGKLDGVYAGALGALMAAYLTANVGQKVLANDAQG